MSFLNSRQHKESGGDSRSNSTTSLTSIQAKDSNAYSEKKPSSNSDSEEEEEEDSNLDSSDDSSSGSDSGTGSDSDSSLKLAPVFISKAKRMSNQKPKSSETKTKTNTKSDSDRKDQALKQIELSIKQDIAILKQQSEDTLGFEGIDDTDGLDPEAERKAWEIREEFRQKRDEEKLLKEQEEFEELQARRM